ncbi:MAG: hypothetical protein EOP84_03175 [Verrucomicrobiaceae bacterium]|nr:MAG: hypothetical protein EOP84_03175 [Verrucomicrobiaceae bacterium]
MFAIHSAASKFDRSHPSCFVERERIQRSFDKGHWQTNQGYQRLKFDPDIHRLLSIYTGLWYLSDRAAGMRCRDAKWVADKPVREKQKANEKANSATRAANAAFLKEEFWKRCDALVNNDSCQRSHRRAVEKLQRFFAQSSDRKWRKRRAATQNIASVALARKFIAEVIANNPAFISLNHGESLHVLAEKIAAATSAPCGQGEDMSRSQLDYHSCRRHLQSIELIESAGGVIFTAEP